MSEQKLTHEDLSENKSNQSNPYTNLFIGLSCMNSIAILTVGIFLYTAKQPRVQKIIAQDFTQEDSRKDNNYSIPLDYFLVNLAEDNELRQFKIQMEFKK